MKNIFWVINKEKLYAYAVSMLTIITLFFMSSILKTDFNDEQFETTSSNAIVENITEENNVINEINTYVERSH